MKQPYTLTNEESAFAAEHHSLIYRYLNEHDLPEDEYYDVIAIGFLNGVRKHFRREDLRRYAFMTLAWRAMDTCYANAARSKSAPKHQAMVLSLQECYRSAYTLEETIADVKDTAEEAIQALSLEETMSRFEEAEREIVRLLANGYPKPEIRRMLGITAEELCEKILGIQQKTLHSPLMQAA